MGGDVPVGCFVENPGMMVSYESGNEQNFTFADCRARAVKHGFPFVGLRTGAPGTDRGTCVYSNNAEAFKGTPNGTTCQKVGDRQVGQGNNNFMYFLPDVSPRPFTAAPVPAIPVAPAPIAGIAVNPRFIGCYKDGENRTMTPVAVDPYIPLPSCVPLLKSRGYRYMGIQNGNPDGTAQCFGSNDLAFAQSLGSSNNCNRFNAVGQNLGGDWANAVYELP